VTTNLPHQGAPHNIFKWRLDFSSQLASIPAHDGAGIILLTQNLLLTFQVFQSSLFSTGASTAAIGAGAALRRKQAHFGHPGRGTLFTIDRAAARRQVILKQAGEGEGEASLLARASTGAGAALR